jgi:DUF2934 family protein
MNTNPQKKTQASEAEDLESQIRLRAFELYQDRRQEDGRDKDDWLRAEEEITGKRARATTAAG